MPIPIPIAFEPGLPPVGEPHILLMYDGSLTEGLIVREGESLKLVSYNLDAPGEPQRIEAPVGEKVVAHASIRSDRGRL